MKTFLGRFRGGARRGPGSYYAATGTNSQTLMLPYWLWIYKFLIVEKKNTYKKSHPLQKKVFFFKCDKIAPAHP